ncbi:DNA translocase FtsK [Cytophagaceae bacterium ABcell3]|nr:DNA translocase FtsK [Cytophagaceae bacterium ABcell3]
MAVNTYKQGSKVKNQEKNKKQKKLRLPSFGLGFFKDKRLHLTIGFFLVVLSFFLVLAFLSFLFTGKNDQSVIEALGQTEMHEAGKEIHNWLGISGAYISYYFIFKWFGVASFLFIPVLFLAGIKILVKNANVYFSKVLTVSLFFVLWTSPAMGYFVLRTEGESDWGMLSGGIGYESAVWLNDLLGWGTPLMLIFILLVFNIFYFNITSLFKKADPALVDDAQDQKSAEEEIQKDMEELLQEDDANAEEDDEDESDEDWVVKHAQNDSEGGDKQDEEKKEPEVLEDDGTVSLELPAKEEKTSAPPAKPTLELETIIPQGEEPIKVEEPVEEKEEFIISESEEEAVGKKIENYDPTLDLASYKYPIIDLLREYETGKLQVSKEELEANKDKIVETLSQFNIGISSIKATIGPTVTLYEIVPDAGIRISKIKNLEDDIALSLAALGIRIIAPIPGKGTIGIEVPNTNREMVAMKSVLSTEKFLKSDKDLPVALGKTISNEVYVIDLAKMPHLLMAGATGQGKSVGLNVLLTSLIYKKHPSQLKFVLIDPKKVELSLFNKIERHFLAKLPDSEDAIITDTAKVVHTLNSLCMEMDNRYELLKDANCRNLKEYNKKFMERRLNPEKGHYFMPYIVLIIDELADLMMTAGKEVETPIARLAQLARAIGIHLVVATQRPSVNVITGIIKANFPARLSFKVTSKIDSRTILDTGGAEQLVGQGDMLLSLGSELIRLQCAFVDTPEVEDVCEYIGSQRGYEHAYHLPEVADEEGEGSGDFDFSERDAMFEEAARTIVTHQQGSTSLLQRKLKLGYNRAGRLIDQLEAAGIVGPFEGSKAREVLITDEYSLEQLLNELNNKSKPY